MADGPPQPHSDTLAPPRKSVELEDPGAHELSEYFRSIDLDNLRTNADIPLKARTTKKTSFPMLRKMQKQGLERVRLSPPPA